MGNNKWSILILAVLLTIAFFAGGLFFSHISQRAINQEVESLYSKDGASVGIFDGASEQDLAAAQRVAEEALYGPQNQENYINLADSQPLSTDKRNEIIGLAPKAPKEVLPEGRFYENATAPRPTSEVHLSGNESVPASLDAMHPAEAEQAPSQIVMITAPVKFSVIRDLEAYKAFKRTARGSYPTVDFAKEMIIVLESDSNFPDNIFEIVSADKQDGALIVSYRVNVLGLSKKINSHSVLPVQKTQLPVELKQVL